MNEKFKEWMVKRFKPNVGQWLFETYNFSYAAMNECWNAAIESTKEKRFGCHYYTNENNGKPWSYCVLDYRKDNELCNLEDNVKSKTDCPHWREIEG